ncbi:WD40 repeat domain-containing protein [Ktedonobacteria bacterium brp13]|nr:WD40 repeat domain-containing protein [Ktedonobacteria bacterium brp13]
MKTFSLPGQCGNVVALAWSPNGHLIAAACEDGTAIVWHIPSGEVVFCRRLIRTRLLTVTWTENGHCLILGSENNTLTVIQIRDGTLVLSQMFDAPVKKISFAPRGRRFLVAVGKTIFMYDDQWRAPLQIIGPSPVLDVAWSPTGGRFAAVCCDVFVYNVLRRRTVYTLTDVDVCEPCSVAWNVNGKDVAIGTAKGTIQIHDGSTGQRFTTYSLSTHRISHLSWGNPCLAALDDCAEMTLWDLLPREHSGVLTQRYPSVQRAFAFSPNGEHIATGTRQRICIASAG